MSFFKKLRSATLAAVLFTGVAATAPAMAATVNGDVDGDGIPNSWEINGYDANGDGVIDVDYPGMGANPFHKDIFVEMDYMPGLLAPEEDLDRIVQVMKEIPLPNPDGVRGINIHLDAGSARSAKYNLGGGNEVPYKEFDGWLVDLADYKSKYFDMNRAPGFHYMVWGDYYAGSWSSGLANFDDKDFIVTVGPTFWGSASSDIRVGVFVHELGHNLNLMHGGDDEVNYKPQYMSVMNYKYALSGAPKTNGTRHFGYGIYDNITLDENALDERRGLGPANRGYNYNGVAASKPIDFNGNGVIDSEPVKADINGDGEYSKLTSPSDLKRLHFQAHDGTKKTSEGPHVEQSGLTAGMAREMGLIP